MVASLFSPIPNRGREPLHMINDHPFGPNEMGVSTYFPSSLEEMLTSHIDISVSADHHVVPCTGDQFPATILASVLAPQTCRFLGSFPRTRGPRLAAFVHEAEGMDHCAECRPSKSR